MVKKPAVTHCIFDLDGTLTDSEICYKQAITDIAREYGKDYTDEVRFKLLGTPEYDSARIAVTEMKLPISEDEFLTKFRDRSHELLKNCALMPGAEQIVRHLYDSQIPLAIATSSTEESYTFKTRRHNDLFKLFRHVVCGGTDRAVKKGKPAPDIFLICASRFQPPAKPAKCLVFEDSVNGVKGAISAKMKCVMIPDPSVPDDITHKATVVVRSLLEVDLAMFGLPPLPV